MKKGIAMMMAAMMLMTGTNALAASDTITNGKAADGSSGTTISAYDTVQYADDAGLDQSGKMATELWLQVDASGQIDVTVPLVLIFQTNIDGGQANTASSYKIRNNSSADLVVTSIETANAEKTGMTQVAYKDSGLAQDTYGVKLSVGSDVEVGTDAFNPWDLNTKSHKNAAIDGGLFKLKKAESNGNGTDTIVDITMNTGKLSFVTSRTSKDALDKTKGLQLLTITYTVALDTSDAVGEIIKGADGSPLTAAGDVQEISPNGSDTVTGILDSSNTVA